MTFIVRPEHEGMTVLQIIKQHIGLSGGMIRHIKFLEDGILLNSERVTVRRAVSAGDVLELKVEDSGEGSAIEGVDLPLPIAYEDDDLVVPDKPPYMPTHPSHGHYDDTVANALAFRYRNTGVPYVFRPINRLDRNTSGLLIIARNRISAARLSRGMLEQKIQKKYIAILDGRLENKEGIIETYMRRTAESIIVREVCGAEEGADYALTRYCVLLESDKHTVVSAEPVTGRTHQLRVHFASLGCPIVGDDIYGHVSEYIGRHALHASDISFVHPSTGERIELSAPLHDDMAFLLKKLFSQEELENEVFEKILWGKG
ncbi:MAG: RluA family pseudouridine synthase [Clostridia bacterium]|nr:RluA family pseudouridine synthase [Clostridia bacterium]